MNIEANNTQNLLAKIEPANATNQNLKWSSSDTTVAIVDPTTGRVTATGKGGDECVITATATDDSGKSANIKIKVREIDSVIKVDQIIFHNSKGEITLPSGSEFPIDAEALPENATNKILKWKSDNESVATVNNGVVTGKAVGYCTITASSTDGSNVVKSIKVRVKEPKTDIKVSSISFDKTTLTISIGDREQIVAKILPAEATNKTLKWMSDKVGVATVNNGIVTGRKAGECTITASSTDGSNVVKSIKVRVKEPKTDITVSSISFDKTTLTISIGDREQIVAKILPAEATNKTLKWLSDKEGVATVNNGIVTGRKAGECTITASSTDGSNVVKSIKVRVQKLDKKVTSIVLDKSNISMSVGDRIQIHAKVLPTNATDKTLEWLSSNRGVATVNKGKIVGVGEGKCTIWATSTDGSNSSSQCSVSVSIVKMKLPYGEWKGDYLNGKPNGQGTIIFDKSVLVTDVPDDIYAHKGYTFRNVRFENGKLKFGGILCDSDGKEIKRILSDIKL